MVSDGSCDSTLSSRLDGSDSSNSSHSLSSSSLTGSGGDIVGSGGGRRFSAANYVTANGKVAPDVLKQIAGFNQGGALQRVHWRRDASNGQTPKQPGAGVGDLTAMRPQSGSTLTLTGEDTDEKQIDFSGWSLNGAQQHDESSNSANSVHSVDYSSDVDADNHWTDRVLELAGVLPNSSSSSSAPTLTNHSPPIESIDGASNQVKLRPNAPLRPPPLVPLSSNGAKKPTSGHRFNLDPSQFAYTFRPHIHRLGLTRSTNRLGDKYQRDLYICLLYLFSTLGDGPLTALFRSFKQLERTNFLTLLTYMLQHLKYRGFKYISRLNIISTSTIGQRNTTSPRRGISAVASPDSVGVDSDFKVLLEANLATEAGLIVLDILNLFAITFRSELESGQPSNPLFQGLVNVYVCLLTTGPSETLLKHVFASLRVFVTRYAKVLFSETTEGLAALCMAGLRTSNLNLISPARDIEQISGSSGTKISTSQSKRCIFDASSSPRVDGLRLEACGLIYRMWRASFDVFSTRGFQRVHLQMIISLSKLVGDIGPEFETSLSLLHSLAEMDVQRNALLCEQRSISQGSSPLYTRLNSTDGKTFLESIEDLIRRIRTVLTATNEMRRYSDDEYRLIDLQYSLAKSYASNPVLRRTWLEELAKLHLASKNMAEVAMAKLHIAALMAEYLRKRDEFPQGCDAFCKMSANIRLEETCQLADPSIVELSYNQEDLLRDVREAAMALDAAGLFEALQPVYALITPIYELRRDFTALSAIYHHLGRAYEAISRAESTGHRLFASYFRVTFFGKAFEGMAGKVYIYRMGACQKLSSIIQHLVKIYELRLGRNRVEVLTENYANLANLSPEKAYIQVTFVEPYVTESANNGQITAFEKHHNVRQFFFENPFIMQPGMTAEASLMAPGPKRTDDLANQWKRRTTLTTEAVFPHLRCRLEVTSSQDIDLSPIDAAIDAIQLKTCELASHIPGAPRDTSISSSALYMAQNRLGSVIETTSSGEQRVPLLLDMQLQGALLPTVNQGPMAYAHAFLAPEKVGLHPPAKVFRLKKLFFEFLTTCFVLLVRYQSLMMSVHRAKYRAMSDALDKYRVDLSNLLNEEVVVDEQRLLVGPKSQIIN